MEAALRLPWRDLEIRGAGSLLGERQHGHMEAVGYDLYCKMLNEAVKEAKGIAVEESFDTSIDIVIDAYIPMGYIPNDCRNWTSTNASQILRRRRRRRR